jgi:hypothetical protein
MTLDPILTTRTHFDTGGPTVVEERVLPVRDGGAPGCRIVVKKWREEDVVEGTGERQPPALLRRLRAAVPKQHPVAVAIARELHPDRNMLDRQAGRQTDRH